jgi:maltooligosyltrehalose trehalohydrolase
MIDMSKVGAFVSVPTEDGVPVRFGIYLPGIEQHDGYELLVRVIHKEDRFNPDIKTKDFPLSPIAGDPNTLWQTSVTIPRQPGTHFGESGTYLYRYQLRKAGNSDPITNWFTDPFARATDEVSQLSAFTTPGVVPDFHWTDNEWRVPEIADLVVYELQVEEFNETFPGVVERLEYLKSLGVNCLELMPVTSLKLNFDWGYGPLHYFAPNERWGGIGGLKHLVNECHRAGIAVILDMVYQHVDPTFPYHQVYEDAQILDRSPMIDGSGPFGPKIDYNKEFARDYVQAANFHWLYEYHVDGFRYDEVTDLFDGPTGPGYAKMAFDAYNESLKIARFTPSGKALPGEYSRIIQCPESLWRTKEVLSGTFSNCAWQDGLLAIAERKAGSNDVDKDFVPQLLLDKRLVDYPETKTVHDSAGHEVDMPVVPFQYVENHDHSQLICFVKELAGEIQFGDRSEFYKLQPFAIALYTCVGVPMLWQGQEFADNYPLPNDGILRTRFQRDVDWQYFYDEEGHTLIRLYRRLGQFRRNYPALRSRRFHYYEEQSRLQDGIVAYSRESTDSKQIALVFLNFSDQRQSISVPVPEAGEYRELINADEPNPLVRSVDQANLHLDVDVPSHYGYIFIKQ